MNRASVLAIRPEKPSLQLTPSDPLPRWEHLPPERQRELVMTLAAMLIKRLPVRHPGCKGVAHE